MIKKIGIALLFLVFCCFVGCNDYSDGDGLVVRQYYFDNYEQYGEFYEIFCDYNPERYVIPENNDSIEFTYFFNGVADYNELETKGYYVDYHTTYISFEVKNLTDQFKTENFGNNKLEFQAVDIENKYDEVYNNFSQIRYKVNTNQVGKPISIFIGDIEVARTVYGADIFVEDENFTTVMNKIIFAFKGDL